MSGASPRHHLMVEPYCILCRQDVKLISAKDVRRGAKVPDGWDEQTMCFFSIPASATEPRRHHMFRFRPVTEGGMYVNTAYDKVISSVLYRTNTVLCHGECGACHLESTANLVHVACHQLARARLGPLSIQLMCDMAWLLRPVVSWRMTKRLIHRERRLSNLPAYGTSSQTQAGSALHMALGRLPIEIQSLISSMIPNGPFKSLALALETVDWVERHGLISNNSNTSVRRSLSAVSPFDGRSLFNRLKATKVDILGEVCLAMLHRGSDEEEDEVTLSDRPIEGVQYSFSTYGVTAIRVHYRDGSTSPWLGKHMPKWTGFLRLDSLDELFVLSDGIKIVSLGRKGGEMVWDESLHTPGAGLEAIPTRDRMDIIWDRDLGSLQGYKASVIDISMLETSVRGKPNTKFAQYLPLPRASDKGSALTLFCNVSGVSSIQIDGDHHSQLGSPAKASVPITFHLRPFEEVDSVYAVTRRSTDAMFCQGPFLLVRTTHNRCLYYGAFIMQSWDPTSGYVSRFGNDSTHRPVALFTDPGKQTDGYHTAIGVVQEQRHQVRTHAEPLFLPALTTLDEDSFYQRNWRHAFLTKTALADVRELRVQRDSDGVRCTGLLADFGDGVLETLGQWDASRTDTASTLYSWSDHGPLHSLTFLLSDGSPNERHVRDIVVNLNEDPEGAHFRWDRLNLEVAWGFTHAHDMLQYWDGTDMDVSATIDNLPSIEVA